LGGTGRVKYFSHKGGKQAKQKKKCQGSGNGVNEGGMLPGCHGKQKKPSSICLGKAISVFLGKDRGHRGEAKKRGRPRTVKKPFYFVEGGRWGGENTEDQSVKCKLTLLGDFTKYTIKGIKGKRWKGGVF